ncbi:unnamed protein product [Bursaphelenchus okinawaensis]|uniref:Tryptophan 2,3-dioxygenase n=1 Tax=Bursaphelenchus okinawaensis TaxID=465554 RepID=A0A811KNY6_9BILA|nr:unnamed protein product [Bursaphelenchus okinawaensis]CAG9107599.1 unnamed protein product [Bursaphelenchus okinawaensis]
MGYGVRFYEGEAEDNNEASQSGDNRGKAGGSGVSYQEYLQLDKVLDAQQLRSETHGRFTVPDEHLFIITHQTYELWFKQIIYDIDHVRNLLDHKYVDETKTLQIVSLLERTVRILKLLVDQMLILETMSPLDFVEFRSYLTSSSGFQSLQFRLLENKLGIESHNRVKYNAQNYRQVFEGAKDINRLESSEEGPSLFRLIDRWLARTPGIFEEEPNENIDQSKNDNSDSDSQPIVQARNNFWNRYLDAVNHYLSDLHKETLTAETEDEKEQALAEYNKTKRSFDTITDNKIYQIFLDKKERRLSHDALKGALMIYFYRDMPRFSQPYQILTYLMDIDSLLQKWRYNHVMLVQRMLGAKQGTGGSSGYLYLRSTVSDRYKVFLDFFNLSTWLIPRAYIPKLSPNMVKTLSEHSNLNQYNYSSR